MTFHELHRGDRPLLLPNAWDVGSAIAFAAAGFPAIGTTSFGVNAASGRPDAEGAGREPTLALVERISALPAYISADIEDGFSDDAEEVADLVAGLGVAGVNLEDSSGGHLVDPAILAAKITAITRSAPDVFVNARVDSYWFHEEATVDAVAERAKRYADAGADGIFVPGVSDPATIEQLAAAIPLPLNVLVVPGLGLDRLGELGVRRVSTGSLPYRVAIDAAVDVAAAVRDGREFPTATSYAEAQQRLIDFARAAPEP
ncbi:MULTISPECIES: isocitrate lyase/PEP mutase family protein [unclassified Leifsonia]|uniref:isocitrate lyase/PEP mutase family protein n=1 Tax=unclassified Leifsonia TaxID=2663824 RepID=UPI000360B78C|nr:MULTISPECIES: isocitrate lyase/phosphoenolpyruvate mutase family protein [unclassified Leifsonia]TDQ02464.1 2-methylisocitrate lyase-like PEP mutase family enzyme [Leifsonia sp. 115AMFTsu3.1]